MNWAKWLGKQVCSGPAGRGRWVRSLLGTLGGYTGGSCGGAQQPTQTFARVKVGLQRILENRGNRMTTNTKASELLDELLARLDRISEGSTPSPAPHEAGIDGASDAGRVTGLGAQAGPAVPLLPDAIDREIAARPRQSAVTKLRRSEVVEQFRRELETQSLTVTTVTAFLQVLQQVLPMLLVK